MLETELQTLRDALRQVPLFANLMEEDKLLRILERGTEIWLQPREKLRSEGDPGDFFVLLEGELEVTKKLGDQEIVLVVHKAGAFFGEVPLLLDAPFFVSGRALIKCHLFCLEKDDFWQVLITCPVIARSIMGTVAQRMQNLESVSQANQKLAALGTLAAGLAHELNNPAAASRSAAGQLRETLGSIQAQALKFYELQPTPAQIQFLAAVQHQVEAHSKSSFQDPLTQSDREDELADWLEDRGINNGWKLAPTLVTVGLDAKWLNSFTDEFSADALAPILTWLEATLSAAGLVQQIEQSSERISRLVQAVKEYSYMDQAPVQSVDVHESLENTLTMLSHKLKQKGVVVTRQYDMHLPHLEAYGSELNQVWTNLIDNAIDAVDKAGHIWIRTSVESDRILVEIADNGSGIAPEIQKRIFEPFFTTKEVGRGTGLGLVSSYRIVVSRHKGKIKVFSQPGDTRFQVRLPLNLAK